METRKNHVSAENQHDDGQIQHTDERPATQTGYRSRAEAVKAAHKIWLARYGRFGSPTTSPITRYSHAEEVSIEAACQASERYFAHYGTGIKAGSLLSYNHKPYF
jgi:hypothetical protein